MPSGWCGGAKRSSILATVMMSLASSHPERRSGSCRCRPGRAFSNAEVLKNAHQDSQRRLASNRGRSHLLEVPGSRVAGCCITNWRYATTRIKSTLLLAGGKARVASAFPGHVGLVVSIATSEQRPRASSLPKRVCGVGRSRAKTRRSPRGVL